MTQEQRTLFVVVPACDELDYLPQTLASIFRQNSNSPLCVGVCVNQPKQWWKDKEKKSVCQANKATLDYLYQLNDPRLVILDKSAPESAFDEKKAGVGMARQAMINHLLPQAKDTDIIVNLDADTLVEQDSFACLLEQYQQDTVEVICSRYLHSLSGNEKQDRAMLHYEIYLRNYFINLARIKSPYAFTALGSAISCTVAAYKSVGGFDSRQSGEDFYFLQKLAKKTKIYSTTTSLVYPANRCSNRVPFGTGPAIRKGIDGDFSAYPLFHYSLFEKIQQTYRLIPLLMKKNIETELIAFLQTVFKEEDFLAPLRKNYKTLPAFTKAFHQKVDALRLFQFLRNEQRLLQKTDDECLIDFLTLCFPDKVKTWQEKKVNSSLATSSLPFLEKVRAMFLFLDDECRILQQ